MFKKGSHSWARQRTVWCIACCVVCLFVALILLHKPTKQWLLASRQYQRAEQYHRSAQQKQRKARTLKRTLHHITKKHATLLKKLRQPCRLPALIATLIAHLNAHHLTLIRATPHAKKNNVVDLIFSGNYASIVLFLMALPSENHIFVLRSLSIVCKPTLQVALQLEVLHA